LDPGWPAPNAPESLRHWIRNPIDRYVAAGLAERQLAPAEPAERRQLIRRVYFDLIGMPPTIDQIQAFIDDRRPMAYERLVDQLLASPRYGERWARHWMDIVHFAETHGHDQDRPREHAWPYRDYLIRSFNQDVPYPIFVRQQIAGDVLFPDDPWSIIATGMLASGPWDESSLRDIQQDSLDREIARYVDRDDIVTTVMSTFTSTSVHCARCHDHKFDPISQRDYYGLQAVFAGIGKGNRLYDADPRVAGQRRELLALSKQIDGWRQTHDDRFITPDLERELSLWQRDVQDQLTTWQPLELSDATSAAGATMLRQEDGSYLVEGQRPDKDIYHLTSAAAVEGITAVRLEVLADPRLPNSGPGRADNGNLHLNHVRVFRMLDDGQQEVHLAKGHADFNQDGWEIAKALDGNPNTAWGIHPQIGTSHGAVFELDDAIAWREPARMRIELHQIHGASHLIGRFRILVTRRTRPLPLPESLDTKIAAILGTAPNDRTRDQRIELAAHFLKQQTRQRIESLPAQQTVYCGTSQFVPDASFLPVSEPRPVFVLQRGAIDSPTASAEPRSLACLEFHPGELPIEVPSDEGQRRAALADWIASPCNVLTARSIVNRLWQYHFGRGLVDTPNDFGLMGAAPTHPRLLDFLAVTLQQHDGSLKTLQRLMVTSATYRQSTRPNSTALQLDADNRLLWRFNRRRIDAESFRDALLVYSGCLDTSMNGPSERHFVQSPGVHVTPIVDYEAFDLKKHVGLRRSVYRFIFRTVPDPFMEALDCPDASQLTASRNESMTPLQALATLNDKFVVRQCELFAARMERETPDRTQAVVRAFTLVMGRPPEGVEQELVDRYAQKHGLANACRYLLNSNEFMFIE
jgi:hypothetical protein